MRKGILGFRFILKVMFSLFFSLWIHVSWDKRVLYFRTGRWGTIRLQSPLPRPSSDSESRFTYESSSHPPLAIVVRLPRSAIAPAAPSAIIPLWTRLGAASDRDEPRFTQRPHRDWERQHPFRFGSSPLPPRGGPKRGPQLSRKLPTTPVGILR